MFDYALPTPLQASHASGGPEAPHKPDGGDADRGRDSDKPRPSRDPAEVHTQMVGEEPGDDLGYDPRIIPTEKIPD